MPPDPSFRDGRSVLLVEDDSDLREQLCELLSGAGYSVRAVADGGQALRLLQDARTLPDAVLLDLMLPVRTGWEVLEVLKNDRLLADIPVLVITAHAHAKVPEADSLLKKPFTEDRLLRLLDEHCN